MGGPPTDKENADMGDTETSTRVHEVGIDRLRDRHVAALNAGDADAWVDCFTDDGVQMPPHFATNAGKSAVRG
jgi:ketosteroid isomerase-like protein